MNEQEQLMDNLLNVDLEIIDVVKANGIKTTEIVTDYLKAGGGCGQCLERIEEIIESVHSKG